MLTENEINEVFESSQSYLQLMKEADRITRARHGDYITLERAIFLSWYCSLASCAFCYMSAHGSRVDREKAKRAPWRILAEAELCRRAGWNIEFLSSGYGAMEREEIKEIAEMIVYTTHKAVWLNIGVLNEDELSFFGEEVEGVTGSIETLDSGIRSKIVPGKPVKPIRDMLINAKSQGFKTGITIILGLGENLEAISNLLNFIDENDVDRVIFYSLNPHEGTEFENRVSPASLYHSRVVAITRVSFPDIKIISGTWADQLPGIGMNLLAGANGITKFPLFSMFGNHLGKRVEQETKLANRKLLGTFSDWKVLKGEKELEEDRNPYTLFNSRIPAVSRRAGERVEYFRPRIDKAVEEYIVRAEEKSRRSKYSI